MHVSIYLTVILSTTQHVEWELIAYNSRYFQGMAQKFVNPAATRNCQPILEALLKDLRPVACTPEPEAQKVAAGREGAVLEVSSGSGQHVVYFAPHFPQLTFFPSEIDDRNLGSIRRYVEVGSAHVRVCPKSNAIIFFLSHHRFSALFRRWRLVDGVSAVYYHLTQGRCELY